MESTPLVTINILSFNRKDELRYTLIKIYEQEYKNIEVIVVDNASNDGSPEMVKNDFPEVQLIQLNKNIGIAGWNKGFKTAKGEYVLVLDDDSFPEKDAIQKVIDNINGNETAVYAFSVYNFKRNFYETEYFVAPYNQFVGCGALINKKIFFLIGEFDESLFIYCHESDFAMRVIEAGYRMEFVKEARINHQKVYKRSEGNPINNTFYYYYSTLNNFVLNVKFLPSIYALLISTKYLLNRILVAIYYHYVFVLIKSIYVFIHLLISGKIKRQVVSKKTLRQFNYRSVPLFDREYYGKLVDLKQKYKFRLILKYILTLFSSSSKKGKYIR